MEVIDGYGQRVCRIRKREKGLAGNWVPCSKSAVPVPSQIFPMSESWNGAKLISSPLFTPSFSPIIVSPYLFILYLLTD